MLHDEAVYPNPDRFDPTRHLTPDGQLNLDASDPAEAAFGFGRRNYPGRYFAMDTIWITQAHILATLNIEMAKDHSGNAMAHGATYRVYHGFD